MEEDPQNDQNRFPEADENIKIPTIAEHKPYFVQTPDDPLHISGLATPHNDLPDEKFGNRVLLVMNINIGDGKKYTLAVMEDDDPYELAQRFCREHELEEGVIDALSQNIYDNMEQVLKESVEVIKQSCRQSSPSPLIQDLQDSPLSKQRRDLIEPDHKEEQFKRFHGSDDDEPLEQIEKDGSEDSNENLEKNVKRIFKEQKDISTKYSLQDQRPFSITPREHEYYNQGSRHIDASINSALKFGDDETRYGSGEYYLKDNLKKRNELRRLDFEGNGIREPHKDWDTDFKRGFIPEKLKRSGTASNKPTQGKTQKDKKNFYVRGETDARTHARQLIKQKNSVSPIRSNIGRAQKSSVSPNRSMFTPRKSPNKNESIVYEQVYLQKEVQRHRQNSNGATKQRADNTHDSIKLSPQKVNVSSVSIYSKNKYGERDGSFTPGYNSREDINRAKSANKPRSDIDGLTFEPRINHASKRIINEKEKYRRFESTVFQRLYHQHKVKEAKQEIRAQMLDDECTFVPAINDYSTTPVHRVPFEERSKHHVQKIKKLEVMKKHKDTHDPSTGKPLFRPSTGRGPMGQRNHQKLPIGEYLYQRSLTQQASTLNSSAMKDSNIFDASLLNSNEKHQGALDKGVKARLEDIFYELDDDRDGYISASNVDINPIDALDLQVIAPILCNMEELEQTLAKDDFVIEALQLIKNLNPQERTRFIYGTNFLSHEKNEEYTFKPQINKKSAEMTKNRRPQGDFNALYNNLMKNKNLKEEKIKIEQEKKQQQELQNCSFRPSVNKKSEQIARKWGGMSPTQQQPTTTVVIADAAQMNNLTNNKKWRVTPMEYKFD